MPWNICWILTFLGRRGKVWRCRSGSAIWKPNWRELNVTLCGAGIVACQRERIAVLKRNGRPTKVAEETLAVFLTTLALFEDHERQLLDRADEAVRTFCETEPLWLDSAADPECSNPAQSATRAIVETVAGLSRLCPR